MNILITGANGFIGKNLTESLKNIRDGKDKTRSLVIDRLYLFDVDSDSELLDYYAAHCDFVFHLAGVNRPKDKAEFMQGNCHLLSEVLSLLKKHHNTCPVTLSSSVQALLDNPYGISKKAGEDLLFAYGTETGAKTLVYRFPNVFGKWCRPNYNSAVATFCHNIANDLSITVNDRNTRLTLVYIDDVVCELLNALEGRQTQNGDFCEVPVTHSATLGEIADLLERFNHFGDSLMMTPIADNSFEKKLYSTFLSYLPQRKALIELNPKTDDRGSFCELLHTVSSGQFSVNVSKPGITKGEHWHHTKWELFIVVYGKALIRQRKIQTEEVLEFEVDGKHPQAVVMLPGYTHSIINLSKTEELITLMWANENFNSGKPDTYYEPVSNTIEE